MNDKCAAGTGRFLGAAAAALEIPLDELGATALRGDKPVAISTTCTVFAESEVLSWLSRGRRIEDILAGVHKSIVARSIGLMRRVGIEPEITFTGGVSKNEGVRSALTDALGVPVNVSAESHFMGALGAALFAMDQVVGARWEDAGRTRA
jgi:predicted CoA-substrate-specific enzyme activase